MPCEKTFCEKKNYFKTLPTGGNVMLYNEKSASKTGKINDIYEMTHFIHYIHFPSKESDHIQCDHHFLGDSLHNILYI